MESGMKALAAVELERGDMAMLSGGALYIYGPEPSPGDQVGALEWGERSGKTFFSGRLGGRRRFIMGHSREALEALAMQMAKGLA